MATPNPYVPTVATSQEEPTTRRFRWRVIPVTLLAIGTAIACVATLFHFSAFTYAVVVGAPEGWQDAHGNRFLRDGIIGLIQIPLLAWGTYYLWKAKYARSSILLIPAFLVRSIVVWFVPL